jgi:RNA polymerase sigma factor (sigma-70 family)
MVNGQLDVMLRQLHQVIGPGRLDELSDGQLLERFTVAHEDAAFAALVRRHGPMVLGVCRRVLHNLHDAEDAFQATFVVLLRRARALDRNGSIANWLYTVAYHAALKARAAAGRRRGERQIVDMPENRSACDAVWRDLQPVLDEELNRLPDKYRTPVVLCYLEGKTNEEAGRLLGWPTGTVKSRLARARELLRKRLSRRGVTLSAGLLGGLLVNQASAAVPAVLTDATLNTVVSLAAGQSVSTPVAALAEGVLQAMFVSKLKSASAVVLMVAAVLLGAGALAHQIRVPIALATPGEPAAPESTPRTMPDPTAHPAEPPKPADKKELTVAGRVLDAGGMPLADAPVAVVGSWMPQRRDGNYKQEVRLQGEGVLAQGKTDREGRYRLTVSSIAPPRFHRLHVLASAGGYGLGWRSFSPTTGLLDLELRLKPERIVSGQLVDLNGLPAAGVKGRVIGVNPTEAGAPGEAELEARRRAMAGDWRKQEGFQFADKLSVKDWPSWPQPIAADEQGRFLLKGFGSGQEVVLLIDDDRFARQELFLLTGDKKPAQEIRSSLVPAQWLEGKVVSEDTRQPMPNVWLTVSSYRQPDDPNQTSVGRPTVAQADEKGRFRVRLYPTDAYSAEVFATPGEPYLNVHLGGTSWPKGAVKHEIEITLPRGVLVKGKLTEAKSGEPIDQARLYFLPQYENNPQRRDNLVVPSYYPVYSAADGSFQLAVPPGPGHLIVTGPTKDFVYQTVSREQLRAGKEGGTARYHHGVVRLDLKPEEKPREVSVTLRRGVRLTGKVVGPDGQPVRRAVLFAPGVLFPSSGQTYVVGFPSENEAVPVTLADGTFELTNCDPDRTYRLFLLDLPSSGLGAGREVLFRGDNEVLGIHTSLEWVNSLLQEGKGRLGAVVEVSAKQAGDKPIVVKLQPCGSAEARFMDAQGKPVKPKLYLELVIEPGPSLKKALTQGVPAARTALLAAAAHPWQKSPLEADEQGRVTIPALISGATYRLKIYQGDATEGQVAFEKDFTVEAGKTLKLPDLVVPAPK